MHSDLNRALAAHGLTAFGVCPAEPGDDLPQAGPGKETNSLILAGNAGSLFWTHFAASPEYGDGAPDPLNRWSARVLSEIATAQGIGLVTPFDGPPFYPFQQWGLRAGNVSQSPLGVLAHKEYGPWFAFRGAFLLADVADALVKADGPCSTCADKPCLDACPGGALPRAQDYRVEKCRAHVAGAGARSCGERGCLVRHACPVGGDYAYIREQAAFHMRAFIGRDLRG